MTTFTMLYDDIMTDSRLNSDQKLAYSSLLRRLSLSKQNPTRFFSKRYHDYFVLFSQQEMAELLGVSLRTVSSIYQQLERLGLIVRKHRFNASDTIFLPDYAKFAGTQKQNLQSSKNNPEKPDSNLVDNSINNEQAKVQNFASSDSPFTRWANATYNLMGLSRNVLNAIGQATKRDAPQASKLVALINNAKKCVLKRYGLNRDKFKYEQLEALDEPLAEKITLVNDLLPSSPTARCKYWTKCMIDFFEQAFGLDFRNYIPRAKARKKKPESIVDPGFEIPTFKIL